MISGQDEGIISNQLKPRANKWLFCITFELPPHAVTSHGHTRHKTAADRIGRQVNTSINPWICPGLDSTQFYQHENIKNFVISTLMLNYLFLLFLNLKFIKVYKRQVHLCTRKLIIIKTKLPTLNYFIKSFYMAAGQTNST